MSSLLFDSDIIMSYFNKQTAAVGLIESLVEKNNFYTSVVSFTEVISGWDARKRKIYIPRLQKIFEGIPVSAEIAEKAGMYRNEYKISGKHIATVDAIIAATAVAHKLTLVTRNKKDFPMKEVKLYKE